ncbi:MAG: acyl-CoA thioesterase, partial [Myxococcaceae bacterium]
LDRELGLSGSRRAGDHDERWVDLHPLGYDRPAMGEPYVLEYRARWADMDFNQHMRNAAYLGVAEETRLRYLEDNGWAMGEFRFFRASDGALCASVESLLLWFDLEQRRTVVPPVELGRLWLELGRTEDFAPLGA